MKKYILAALFCGTFTFCSCSGFLDEVPKGQITTESYYRTEQHAISATNAIYNYLIMGVFSRWFVGQKLWWSLL